MWFEIAAACCATTVALVVLRAVAPALALVDAPGGRHLHDRPVPRVGGVAVLFGIVISSLTGGGAWIHSTSALPVAFFVALGIADDVFRDRFPWPVKLGLQIGAAWLLCAHGDLSDRAVRTAIVVGVVNAANFFDHADLMLSIALLPGILAMEGARGAAAAGSLLIFAIFNCRRLAFAGDAGSHGLTAFILAFATPSLWRDGPADPGGVVAALAGLSVVVLDACVVVGIRIARRIPPWRATPVHLANRFKGTALEGRAALPVALWAVVAVVWPRSGWPWLAGVAVVLLPLALRASKSESRAVE